MSSENVAISIRGLTKRYRLFNHPGDRVKQFFSLGFRQFHREFTALESVSTEIRRGETVGVIGRNGSGKSTLLQCVCGILKPNKGLVSVNGRISALLELGSGFDPDFTGRENVYFQGVLMGLSRAQVDQRFDDIASFAEVGGFIDQPVRTYSSGMFVRLAFAVAVSVDPDILVVDEALAVGDAQFQAKCFRRIDEIRQRGGTILIVSHSLEQLGHYCDRILLLDQGKLLADDDAGSTLSSYLQLLGTGGKSAPILPEKTVPAEESDAAMEFHPGYRREETRWGDRQATIDDIRIVQNGLANPKFLVPGLVTEVFVTIRFHTQVENPVFGFTVKNRIGVRQLSVNSRELSEESEIVQRSEGECLTVSFRFNPFLERGEYTLSFGVSEVTPTGQVLPYDRRYDSIAIHVAFPQSQLGEPDMNPSFHTDQARIWKS